MDARQARRGKRISLQQERRTAADLGGRTTAGSGAAKFSGGADVRVMGKTRVECKYTEKSQFVLKISELEKLRKQAIKSLEYPVFQFAFREPSGRLQQYAVVPWNEDSTQYSEWSTEKKSMTLEKTYLAAAVADGLTKIAFHVRGPTSLRSRYFRLLSWDDFVDRHKANA